MADENLSNVRSSVSDRQNLSEKGVSDRQNLSEEGGCIMKTFQREIERIESYPIRIAYKLISSRAE